MPQGNREKKKCNSGKATLEVRGRKQCEVAVIT